MVFFFQNFRNQHDKWNNLFLIILFIINFKNMQSYVAEEARLKNTITIAFALTLHMFRWAILHTFTNTHTHAHTHFAYHICLCPMENHTKHLSFWQYSAFAHYFNVVIENKFNRKKRITKTKSNKREKWNTCFEIFKFFFLLCVCEWCILPHGTHYVLRFASITAMFSRLIWMRCATKILKVSFCSFFAFCRISFGCVMI